MKRPALSMSEFCKTVEHVVASLPPPFDAYLENLVVDVEERPSDRDLRQLGMKAHEWNKLFGYFAGAPLTEQGYGDRHPNRITLFKQSIEAASRSKAEIRYEIRRTILHELAHHFGYSEDDLDEFESIESPYGE